MPRLKVAALMTKHKIREMARTFMRYRDEMLDRHLVRQHYLVTKKAARAVTLHECPHLDGRAPASVHFRAGVPGHSAFVGDPGVGSFSRKREAVFFGLVNDGDFPVCAKAQDLPLVRVCEDLCSALGEPFQKLRKAQLFPR